MSIKSREQVKLLLAENNVTMKELAKNLSAKIEKDYTLANFSSRLKRGTLNYDEMLVIADLLGYEIKFVRKS